LSRAAIFSFSEMYDIASTIPNHKPGTDTIGANFIAAVNRPVSEAEIVPRQWLSYPFHAPLVAAQ